MDIAGKSVLILGGYGLVGQAVARRLIRESPREIVLLSLRKEEADEAVASLRAEAGSIRLEPAWGDVFTFTDVKDAPRKESPALELKAKATHKSVHASFSPAHPRTRVGNATTHSTAEVTSRMSTPPRTVGQNFLTIWPFSASRIQRRAVTASACGNSTAPNALRELSILVVALRYLPRRARFVRDAGVAQRFVDGPADLELFALRAIASQPLHVLARVSDDPMTALRERDRAVIARLADLELRHRSAGPRRGPHPRPQRHRDIFGSPSDIASVWAGRNVIGSACVSAALRGPRG